MKNSIFKISLIFLVSFFMFIYIFPWKSVGINIPFLNGDYRLGLDLQGGVELDYKIDLEEYRKLEDYSKDKEKEDIEKLKEIMDQRIESLNINDSELNTASYGGEKHIVVQIPLKGNSSLENNKNIERAKDAIGKVVKIVFREEGKITDNDYKSRLKIAELALKELNSGEQFSVVADKNVLNHQKVYSGKVADLKEIIKTGDGNLLEGKLNEVQDIKTGEDSYFLYKKDSKNIFEYLLISKIPSVWKDATDSKGRVLNDRYFKNSSVQADQIGNPEIEIVFNDEGAKIFSEISERLIGKRMAIFIGGKLLTAPNINEKIPSGVARISGDYTSESAKELSTSINSGVVPFPVYITSEKTIDSKIGANSLSKLIIAGVSGFLIIFLFLVYIYRLSGFVASIALLIYSIIILFVLKLLGVVLTSASIAGLVLSLGMAIDANILIFERIKGELKNGGNIEESIKIGFSKTWSAIFDSNLTGLIVALILFWFGINMIKGFGLMLAIGIIVSFFTVMVISRIFIIYLAQVTKSKNSFIGFKK